MRYLGMSATFTRLEVLICSRSVLAILVAILLHGAARGTPSEESASRSMLNPGAFTSAEICAACHKDIHAGWSSSAHARSYTNAVFGAAIAALPPGRANVVSQCLGCHAPTTL